MRHCWETVYLHSIKESPTDHFLIRKAAGLNHDMAKNLGINFVEEDVELRYDTVVDCLFGAGLNRKVSGRYRDLIERVNKEHGNYSIFSVDLPSGINGSSAKVG